MAPRWASARRTPAEHASGSAASGSAGRTPRPAARLQVSGRHPQPVRCAIHHPNAGAPDRTIASRGACHRQVASRKVGRRVEESPGSPPEAARQPVRGRRRGGSDARRPRVWDAEGLGLDVLAALGTASADGITILDSSRHIVYANPAACAVLGHPLDHLLGADWLSFVPEGERETVLTLFASAARSGSSPAVAIAARRPDGVEQEIELTATALDLPGRRLLVAAFRDVTERHHPARQAAVLAQA